jgi:hypothetical protein
MKRIEGAALSRRQFLFGVAAAAAAGVTLVVPELWIPKRTYSLPLRDFQGQSLTAAWFDEFAPLGEQPNWMGTAVHRHSLTEFGVDFIERDVFIGWDGPKPGAGNWLKGAV